MFLTEGDRQKDTSGYTQLEKLNYARYGYRYIEATFCPHITLGKIPNQLLEKTRQKINYLFNLLLCDLVAQLNRVTIYQLGRYGSHASSLYELNI